MIAPPSDPELGWAWPQLVKADEEPPPLRSLQPVTGPEGNGQDSHPSPDFRNGGLALPMVVVR
jgi:hypothetical protein